jgi:hypothetical protein
MTMPVPTTRQNPLTGQTEVWVEYDDGTGQGEWVPAVSTPDQSTFAIPVEFKVAINTGAPGLAPKIEEAQKPGETWTDTYIRIATGLSLGLQQIKFMQLNVDRAKKGLPPVDANAYSGAYVNVGLDPNTQRLVTYAGLGILALFVLNMATRK